MRRIVAPLALAGLLLTSSCFRGDGSFLAGAVVGGVLAAAIISSTPPPPPRVVEAPPPRPGYVWQPGFWQLQGDQWVWITGRWVPENPGYQWIAPHWVQQPNGSWRLEPGRWVAVP